jgi:hypothetical protein
MELSMALNGYGIPTDRLPLKYDGTIKIEDHLQWIAVREAKEDAFRAGRNLDVVECPMNMDILCGRGQVVRSHPGNVSFRQDFIQTRSSKYNAAQSRDEKNEIADEILSDIASLSRQFLKQHASGYWTELESKVAKEKVMMAFREYRKSQKLEESRNTSSSRAADATDISFVQHQPLPFPPQHHYPPAPSHPQHYPFHHPPAYPPFLPYPPEFAASASHGLHPPHLLHAPRPMVSGSNASPPRRTRFQKGPADGNMSHKRHKTG